MMDELRDALIAWARQHGQVAAYALCDQDDEDAVFFAQNDAKSYYGVEIDVRTESLDDADVLWFAGERFVVDLFNRLFEQSPVDNTYCHGNMFSPVLRAGD